MEQEEGSVIKTNAVRQRTYIALGAMQPVFMALAALLIRGYHLDAELVGLWMGLFSATLTALGFSVAAVNVDMKKK